jgi:hypothetical protein
MLGTPPREDLDRREGVAACSASSPRDERDAARALLLVAKRRGRDSNPRSA